MFTSLGFFVFSEFFIFYFFIFLGSFSGDFSKLNSKFPINLYKFWVSNDIIQFTT